MLHARRGRRHYTALYSNSELAHDLGKTQDWVVLYYSVPGQAEQQVTIVTETHGPRKGRRVVRGRAGPLHHSGHTLPALPVEADPLAGQGDEPAAEEVEPVGHARIGRAG